MCHRDTCHSCVEDMTPQGALTGGGYVAGNANHACAQGLPTSSCDLPRHRGSHARLNPPPACDRPHARPHSSVGQRRAAGSGQATGARRHTHARIARTRSTDSPLRVRRCRKVFLNSLCRMRTQLSFSASPGPAAASVARALAAHRMNERRLYAVALTKTNSRIMTCSPTCTLL